MTTEKSPKIGQEKRQKASPEGNPPGRGASQSMPPVSDRDLLRHLLDNVPEYIYFKDLDSRFIRISKSHATAFGLNDPSEAVGKSDFDFFSMEHAQFAYEGEQEVIRTGQTLSVEEKETRPGQPDAWVLSTKMPLYDGDGKIIGTFGISKDITERKMSEESLRVQAERLKLQIKEINQLQAKLQEQATHDTLTGLNNRRIMDQILTKQVKICRQLKLPFSILLIDIDHFKNINDKFGHLVGDAILEEFGRKIRSLTRADDFSCRMGGDEILLSFHKMAGAEIINKAEIIRKALTELVITKDGRRISATVSIGIASFPEDGTSIKELIACADEALYKAKKRGRNQVVLAGSQAPTESGSAA